MLETVARAPGRAKQELVARIGPLQALSDRVYERRLRAFAPHLATPRRAEDTLVRDLEEHGVAVGKVTAHGFSGTEDMQAGAAELRDRLRVDRPGAGHTSHVSREAVLRTPAVWRWALSSEVLDLVERYLGLPARYLGASVRCEQPTGVATGVRQWHRDIEDRRMLKILIWLNDVDLDGGPFEYIDRSRTEHLARSLHYASGYVGDERVERIIARDEWRQATGPEWTCVLADPRNVFHRAMPPVGRARYSLTYSFTSRTPLRVLPTPSLSEVDRELAREGLDERQLACLPPALARRRHR